MCVNDKTWIGLHDAEPEYGSLGAKGFVWDMCIPLSPSAWTNWALDEPVARYSNWCVRMTQGELDWQTDQCPSMAHFLCQQDLVTYNTTTTFNTVANWDAFPDDNFDPAEVTQQIVQALLVDKRHLSSTRRKLTCAIDNRPTAKATGTLGVVLLVGFAGLVILPDLRAIYMHVRHGVYPEN
nr:hypothetical protein BaRGS_016431 [Batillaria attramentaria]